MNVHICIYIYICVYMRIHMYIYIYIHMYILIYKNIHMYIDAYIYICIYIHVCVNLYSGICTYEKGRGMTYGVATISRLLKMIGLFGRILSLLKGSFAKETYDFKEPTNRLQHTAPHCTTLQLTATHCNALQHTKRLK